MGNTNTRYHHGDLYNALLSVAEHLLEQKGLSGVSLRDVAKVAGVSHAAPYRHFKDKTTLLTALSTIGYQRLSMAMEQCMSDHPDDPLAQLSHANHAYVSLACKHPQLTNLMFGGVIQADNYTDKLKIESNRAFEGLLNIVHNGQAAGLFIGKDAMEIALLIWSTIHGFSMLCSSGHLKEAAADEKQISKLTDGLGEMLLSGIVKK